MDVSAGLDEARAGRGEAHIIIAADLFRLIAAAPPHLHWHQEHNVRWLRCLMTAALAGNPAIRIDVLDHAVLGLTTETFGPRTNMAMEDWWIDAINRPVSPNLADKIGSFVRNAIVIGFELPENLRVVLAGSARLLIEMEVSPIRFMDDLFLTVTSSDDGLNTIFARAEVSRREIAWQLELVRHHMGPLAIESGSLPPRVALLAAQTRVDRVLVSDGALIDLADHSEDIRRIADAHDLLLIAPHPHTVGEISGILALLNIPGVRITAANSYRLLASGQIATLTAISSSLLAEAEYFGVEPIRLDSRQPRAGFMIRAQALGEEIADAIAAICGFDLPRLNGRLPSGPVLQDLLGFNWGLTDVGRSAAPLPAMVLPPGEAGKIDVQDPAMVSALAYGWFPVEPWGVWGGPLSICSFAWPGDIAGPLTCTLDLVAFTGDRRAQTIDLWIDGEKISSVTVPAATVVEWSFDVARPVRPGPVQLWLVSDGLRPAAFDPANDDRRLLGLGLKSFLWRWSPC